MPQGCVGPVEPCSSPAKHHAMLDHVHSLACICLLSTIVAQRTSTHHLPLHQDGINEYVASLGLACSSPVLRAAQHPHQDMHATKSMTTSAGEWLCAAPNGSPWRANHAFLDSEFARLDSMGSAPLPVQAGNFAPALPQGSSPAAPAAGPSSNGQQAAPSGSKPAQQSSATLPPDSFATPVGTKPAGVAIHTPSSPLLTFLRKCEFLCTGMNNINTMMHAFLVLW